MRLIVLGCCLWASCLLMSCGMAKVKKREGTIDRQFGAFERSGYVERARTWLPIIQDNLMFSLRKRPSWRYDYPLLKEHLEVIQSEDERLRIFNWNNRAGNRGDFWSVVAQYKGKGGVHGTLLTDGYYSGPDAFIGVSISRIFTIEACNQQFYLTLGSDLNENQTERWVFQILQIIGEELVVCQDCFAGQKELLATITEGEEFNYSFDPLTKQIRFVEFVIEPDGGDSSREVTYGWENCKFVKK